MGESFSHITKKLEETYPINLSISWLNILSAKRGFAAALNFLIIITPFLKLLQWI